MSKKLILEERTKKVTVTGGFVARILFAWSYRRLKKITLETKSLVIKIAKDDL